MDLVGLLDLISPGIDPGDIALVAAMWRAEQPDDLALVEQMAAAAPAGTTWHDLVADAAFPTAVRLTHQARYGNPGLRPAADVPAWRDIGYTTEPPTGAAWPPVMIEDPVAIGFGAVRDSYDVVVVGSGCGSVAAHVAAAAGARVLVVEAGGWLGDAHLHPDPLRNQRVTTGLDTPAGPPTSGNPRVGWDGMTVGPTDRRWANNAFTLGGGTRVYGAQAWRFSPEDFRMATTYGVPDGSSLADWPIGYDELAPYYDHIERVMGVSGLAHPMPPTPMNRSGELLTAAADRLGWATTRVPLLVNSLPYGGRPACPGCGACVGFACRAEAKNGTQNTVLPLALATGRCDLVLGTRAVRIEVDRAGRVTSVVLVDVATGARRTVRCGRLVLAAGAVETPRLLLLSAHDGEPTGLGNRTDNVGRHLQAHVYTGAVALTDEVVQHGIGPGPTVSVQEFRHHNPGIVGGGMLANDFVPLPMAALSTLQAAGLLPLAGPGVHEGLTQAYRRHLMTFGPIQEVTMRASRVTLATDVVDGLGLPVARFSGSVHPEDLRTAQFMADRAVEWLTAAGARDVRGMAPRPDGPSAGQHQAGTCRMGDDPASSVVDPTGRVWGHENLHVADTSVHVTNGPVNPVLTGLALAWRTAELMERM
jgi:choline dehydrogenase-like flavoprotein